jgi:hypothetical protein
MRTLKAYFYEIFTALALMGIVHILLVDQMLTAYGKAMLAALFFMIAVATEAVIVCSLRPHLWRAVGANLLVAGLVFVTGWTSTASLKVSVVFATATLILRPLIAAASLRASRVAVTRSAAGLVGITLLVETLFTAYGSLQSMYYDYYLYPRVKDRYIMPLRWQDLAFLVLYWIGAATLVYLSYRLLKYALGHRSRSPLAA